MELDLELQELLTEELLSLVHSQFVGWCCNGKGEDGSNILMEWRVTVCSGVLAGSVHAW